MTAENRDWIYEDELPDGYPYDEMFPFSRVDIVRLFPGESFVAGYLAAASQAAKSHLALRNCAHLARKFYHQGGMSSMDFALHIMRCCDEGGAPRSILREGV